MSLGKRLIYKIMKMSHILLCANYINMAGVGLFIPIYALYVLENGGNKFKSIMIKTIWSVNKDVQSLVIKCYVGLLLSFNFAHSSS